MSRIKMFDGRRVLKARRRGEVILVKLAAETADGRPQWIAVTLTEYDRKRAFSRRGPRREQ